MIAWIEQLNSIYVWFFFVLDLTSLNNYGILLCYILLDLCFSGSSIFYTWSFVFWRYVLWVMDIIPTYPQLYVFMGGNVWNGLIDGVNERKWMTLEGCYTGRWWNLILFINVKTGKSTITMGLCHMSLMLLLLIGEIRGMDGLFS